MTSEQSEALLNAAQDQPTIYLALFFTLARTGLRPGEAHALRADDFEL